MVIPMRIFYLTSHLYDITERSFDNNVWNMRKGFK